MKKIVTLFCLLVTLSFYGQNDFKKQFKVFSIEDKKLGVVEFCTYKYSIEEKKPIMLFIHGSGNEPTFSYHKDVKKYAWKAFKGVDKYKDDFHVIFVNKPGTPIFDTIQKDSVNHKTSYPLNEEFVKRYSLEWRAKSASLIINKAIKLLNVDKSKILVIGHSEGGQVAPKVAVINKKVTHVAILNTNSLHHFYDYILQERLEAFLGNHSFEQSQSNIDYYFSTFQNIYSNRLSTSETWKEETYLKWASFNEETPLENMLKLKIPIYLVAGGKDIWNSFIMNTDYAKIEFLRKGKKNLTYKVYPNANHFLEEELIQKGKAKKLNLKPTILKDIVKWIEDQE